MGVDSKGIERVAEIRAAIDLGRERSTVLTTFGLSSDAWTELELATIELLADEVDRGETANLVRYKAAYDAARGADPAALIAGAPPIADAPARAAVVAAAVAVVDVDQTDMIDGSAIREQLLRGSTPFDKHAAPALPVRPAAAAPPAQSGETLMADGAAIREALLRGPVPFAPPSADTTNETMMADGEAIREALLKGPLPFAEAKPAAEPAAKPPATPAAVATDETVALQRPDLSLLLKKRGE